MCIRDEATAQNCQTCMLLGSYVNIKRCKAISLSLSLPLELASHNV